jgi:3,4-dihydroxy 2-butanone 4-phosphate synthase/GTP cyclohydrolase II
VHIADTMRDLLGIRGDSKAWTLRAALERIAHAGSGALVILRNRETGESMTPSPQPSPPAGERVPKAGEGEVLRTYGLGAQILKDMGVRRMRVLSAPKQMHGISAFDLEIEGYVSEES